MTGIQYLKNKEGETTHLVADWSMYGELLKQFLEDIEDIETIRNGENEETLSLEETIEALAKQAILPGEVREG